MMMMMMRLNKWAVPVLACGLMWTGAQAQSGRGGEWTTHSGDPQRRPTAIRLAEKRNQDQQGKHHQQGRQGIPASVEAET
jgi:hypothetical protein